MSTEKAGQDLFATLQRDGFTLDGDGKDIFVIIDGVKIAKRGRPGSSQARAWVSLEPGWKVTGTDQIDIEWSGVRVQ
jgi:hypothetical protein